MSKKIVRLTEQDLNKLVKKIIKEESDIDIGEVLTTIFEPLNGDNFNVEVTSSELECYVDIMGYEGWDEVYPYILDATEYIKSKGGKLGNIILSDEGMGEEVVRKTIMSAKKYSDSKDVTIIRAWFELENSTEDHMATKNDDLLTYVLDVMIKSNLVSKSKVNVYDSNFEVYGFNGVKLGYFLDNHIVFEKSGVDEIFLNFEMYEEDVDRKDALKVINWLYPILDKLFGGKIMFMDNLEDDEDEF